ncbi:MAG: hypothetical protein WAV53_11440, partial [Anaerolineae bacterium]
DPPRSVYGMLGSGAPAEPDRTGLGEPANPSLPTACLWTPPPKLRPTAGRQPPATNTIGNHQN